MSRILGVTAPGQPALLEAETEPVRDGGFRVRTAFSGVSAGTELTFVKGTNPYLHASWNSGLGVFEEARPALAYPVTRLGYMEVGRVVESRTSRIAEGTVVAMAYGHAEEHVADAAKERWTVLPGGLDPLLGVFVAHMGPICANGLLHAAAELYRGDVRRLGDGIEGLHVVVHGGGTVGLLVALLARHHGAAEVAVIDRTPQRLAAARGLGCVAVDERDGAPWRAIKDHWPAGPGADVAFQCRGRDEALAEALRCVRPQGTVIDLAFYTGGAPALRLGEEFHHNGLTIRCAQVGRVPRGLAHLWDRARLSRETLVLLDAHGDLLRRHVISDVVPFEQGPELLADVSARRRHVIQAVLAC